MRRINEYGPKVIPLLLIKWRNLKWNRSVIYIYIFWCFAGRASQYNLSN